MHNEKLGDGSQWPFQVVNFHDGTNPTAPPHNLPLLSNCAVVDNLSDPQCTLYFLGYYPGEPVPNQIATRKKKILAAIGHWRI
ncbi:hypothetical protein BOTBODRAFT_28285 [Botryobasidium botryosum FD-172 SS1]|uniref:Mug135-like C-terminal domain-containing protein n=1 Tax=Botryobasidium botryosum (strain FD-172 SS1) TaxID=930990 RepID=A0A067MT54_BOTB1|nr:hypothetical protein BOTBODRAFT_28285 [Botryobasidium botryosum FD-172 SS1]